MVLLVVMLVVLAGVVVSFLVSPGGDDTGSRGIKLKAWLCLLLVLPSGGDDDDGDVLGPWLPNLLVTRGNLGWKQAHDATRRGMQPTLAPRCPTNPIIL